MIRNPVERLVVASSMSVMARGDTPPQDGTPVRSVRRGVGRNASGGIRCWLMDPPDPGADGRGQGARPRLDLCPDEIQPGTKCLIIGANYGSRRSRCACSTCSDLARHSPILTPACWQISAPAVERAASLGLRGGHQHRDFVHVGTWLRRFAWRSTARMPPGKSSTSAAATSIRSNRWPGCWRKPWARADIGPEIMDKARAGDVRHCFADITKARDCLATDPRQRLETALPALADWIRQSTAQDRGEHAKRELEAHGLVA